MAGIACTPDNPCTVVQLIKQDVDKHEEESNKRLDKVEAAIESLRNRLPLWATMSFTAGGMVIGWLLNIVVKR